MKILMSLLRPLPNPMLTPVISHPSNWLTSASVILNAPAIQYLPSTVNPHPSISSEQ
jgi:hypothetical protein